MNSWFFGIIFVIFTFGEYTESAKILGLFTSPSISHQIIHKPLMKALAKRGHEVTIASMFPPEPTNMTNYHQINIAFKEDMDKVKFIQSLLMKKADIQEDFLKGIYSRTVAVSQIANNSLNHPAMKKLMRDGSFDLIIFSWFVNDFVLGVSGHFKCPTVLLSTLPTNYLLRQYIGSPSDVEHSPGFIMNNVNPFNFVDRLKNFIALGIEQIYFWAIDYFFMEPLYQQNFPSPYYPSLNEVRQNVSLVLVNYHYSQGVIRSYVPGMIEVGGLHINTNPKELPSDIKNWLDDAPNGVIYFSLGTNLRSSEMSESKRDAILKAFSSISAKVLWKFEADDLPNKPENVMIKKWLPQEDVLNHKNVRLFISHCGASSANEAIYYGVPVLGMPIFADQHGNLQSLLDLDMAIGLPFIDLTEATFLKSLQESLNNGIYLENARRLSKKYQDRPMRPMDTALYWIEYVLRHDGAKHMQSPAVKMGLIQRCSIDVITFLIVVLVAIFVIFKYLLKSCFKCVFTVNKLKNE